MTMRRLMLLPIVMAVVVALPACHRQESPAPQASGSQSGQLKMSESQPERFAVVGYAEPEEGPAPLVVHFHPYTFERTDVIKILWEFGDGSTSNEEKPTHTYAKPGEYTAKVTVTWAPGETNYDESMTITVEEPGQGAEAGETADSGG
jgi:PKD repeat protein